MYAGTEYFDEMAKQLDLALRKHNKTREDLKECTEIIKNWLKTQPHLPEMPDDILIGNFLFMNKFSIEGTKQRLDMYYTKQSLIPDFFENNHPNLPTMKSFMDVVYFFPIPKSTDEGYRITIFKLIDTDPDHFHTGECCATYFNNLEIRLHEDYFVGEILVYDFQDMSYQHILKITPMIIRKIITVLEKVFNNSLHQIHVFNYPSYADPIIKIAKQIMNPKLTERLHLHPSVDTVSNIVPKKYLPEEFGGEQKSLKELHGLWKLKMEDYSERFDVLSKLKVDETKRPSPLINNDLLGFYGNFKKLDVD